MENRHELKKEVCLGGWWLSVFKTQWRGKFLHQVLRQIWGKMRQRECHIKYQKSICIREGTLFAHTNFILFFFFPPCAGMEYSRVLFCLSKDCVIIRGVGCNAVQVVMNEKWTQEEEEMHFLTMTGMSCRLSHALQPVCRGNGCTNRWWKWGSSQARMTRVGFWFSACICWLSVLQALRWESWMCSRCHHLHLYLFKNHSVFLNKLTLPLA